MTRFGWATAWQYALCGITIGCAGLACMPKIANVAGIAQQQGWCVRRCCNKCPDIPERESSLATSSTRSRGAFTCTSLCSMLTGWPAAVPSALRSPASVSGSTASCALRGRSSPGAPMPTPTAAMCCCTHAAARSQPSRCTLKAWTNQHGIICSGFIRYHGIGVQVHL